MSALLDRTGAAWNAFWFSEQSLATVALFRIAVGLLALGWALSIGFDLRAFYMPDGLLQPIQQLRGSDAQGYALQLWRFSSAGQVWAAWAVLVLSSMLVTVGAFTRISTAVTWALLLVFQHANPWTLDAGDRLIAAFCMLLVFCPAGACLSIDRWRRLRPGEAMWECPAGAAPALRLVQMQVCWLYVGAAVGKLRTPSWRDGSAVSYALRHPLLHHLPVPDALLHVRALYVPATLGTIAIELAIPILVWDRRLRPWVLGAGIALHLGIDYALLVGFFSWAVITGYVSFLPPDAADRLVHRFHRVGGAPQP